MSWIKRNLYFFIGSLVALALMGMAGWYLYSKWQLNNDILTKLNEDYENLRRFNDKKPHPGSGNVNNVDAAKEQHKQLRAFIQNSRTHFQPIPPIPIPESRKVTDHEFSTALTRTIDLMSRDATNASVALPSQYNFSFEALKKRLSFSAGSLEPLSTQLGEIKTICDVLFQAKINALDYVHRERVCTEDATTAGDYVSEKSVTNELAVLTPYELSFRCFSSELASVLAGFASSPYCLLVKTINVEPAAPAVPDATTAAPAPTSFVAPAPVYTPPSPVARLSEQDAFNRRYGLGGRRPLPQPQPQAYVPMPSATPAAVLGKGGLPTVLDEKPLKITLMLNVVKLVATK